MWRIYSCIANEHDHSLLLVAAAICLFGSIATFALVDRVARTKRRILAWYMVLALCGGVTVWATHFVAMLAYQQNLPVTFELFETVSSLISGIIGLGLGFALILRSSQRFLAIALGGSLLGLGVSALHYIGLSGLRLPGTIQYSTDLVIASIVASIAYGLLTARHLRVKVSVHTRSRASLAFFLMIVSLHFTGIGSLNIELGFWDGTLGSGLSRSTLSTLVTVTSVGLLAFGLMLAIFDHKRSIGYAREAARFRVLADSTLEGLVIHQNGLLMDFNAAAGRLLDLHSKDLNQPITSLFAAQSDHETFDLTRLQSAESIEIELTPASGEPISVEISGRPIEMSDGSLGQVLAVRDLRQRKQAEEWAEHQASHDGLTGMPNRIMFSRLAEEVLTMAREEKRPFALFMIDIDGFKAVNDLHGHFVGDEILQIAANRLKNCLGEHDILARIGGDEFAILQIAGFQPDDGRTLAEELIQSVAKPIRVQEGLVTLGASIGISLYPNDGGTIEALTRHADTAMYRAKDDGRRTYRFFESSMDDAVRQRRRLERRLQDAIKKRIITVNFQPLVDAKTRMVRGCEALVRWTDPELGFISPAEFIPVAEQTGQIIDMGEEVLRQACEAACAWPDDIKVAVNLSPVQFRRPGLVETVNRILQETGLPGDRLELEITESTLIDDRDRVLETLRAFKARGIGIVMDDFGTGFSSLSYLQSFPFGKIKIDQVFVSNMVENAQNASIVRAVIALGHSLEMTVVAEGVETEAQASRLSAMQCDKLQGYLIARPMPQEDLLTFVTENNAKVRRAAMKAV